jgi:hypothetical protein
MTIDRTTATKTSPDEPAEEDSAYRRCALPTHLCLYPALAPAICSRRAQRGAARQWAARRAAVSSARLLDGSGPDGATAPRC